MRAAPFAVADAFSERHFWSFSMSFSIVSGTRINRLLAALPREIYDRLLPHFELVALAPQQILHPIAEPIAHVYFPINSIVSLTNLLSDGSTVEVGLVGHNGLVGVPVMLGEMLSRQCAIVQIADRAVRLRSDILCQAFDRDRAVQAFFLRYVQVLLLQMSQLAACQRFHSVRERLARQLLLIQDALETNEFPITHECLAQMLGARRSSISVAAGDLSRLGIIRYSRGRMTILQPSALEAVSCECYSVIRNESKRFFVDV